MVPPAPPRLSTTICCPNAADHDWPTRRAVASTDSPAGNGTTMRMGLAGYCAKPPVAAATNKSVDHASLRFIISSSAKGALPSRPVAALERLDITADEIDRSTHGDGVANVVRKC